MDLSLHWPSWTCLPLPKEETEVGGARVVCGPVG
jgi:hypothetical protein